MSCFRFWFFETGSRSPEFYAGLKVAVQIRVILSSTPQVLGLQVCATITPGSYRSVVDVKLQGMVALFCRARSLQRSSRAEQTLRGGQRCQCICPSKVDSPSQERGGGFLCAQAEFEPQTLTPLFLPFRCLHRGQIALWIPRSLASSPPAEDETCLLQREDETSCYELTTHGRTLLVSFTTT